MIHVYGLSYLLGGYIERSIIDISCNASEPIHFTIIDNKSESSDSIRQFAKGMIIKGFSSRLVGMKYNSRGNALIDIVRQFPPDDSEDFFVITDLDLHIPKDLDWIKELRACRAAGANIAGFDISLENYVPPNRGHTPGVGIGWWLMLLGKKKFFELPKDVAYTDSYLINELGPLHIGKGELYHLTFDAWKDYPDYFALKEKGIPWNKRDENEIEEVYE